MKMNLILISFVAVASLSVFPTRTFGLTDTDIEQPKALPLSLSKKEDSDRRVESKPVEFSGLKSSDVVAELKNDKVGEVWQETDHEVLIRNERGANKKDGGAGGAGGNGGKKEGNKNKKDKKNKQSNQQKQLGEQDQTQTTFTQTLKQSHSTHGNKNKNSRNGDVKQDSSSCRYVKSPWTECDAKSNSRSRTLTLKKGEEGCVQTRTIQKKCKKACRYEKGAWSECVSGQMSRTDKLKTTSDATCQITRVVNKNCNPAKVKGNGNKEQRNKGNKDKGNRKSRA